MTGTMHCAVLDGFGAKSVWVEADVAGGLPNFLWWGLRKIQLKNPE